MVKRKNTKKLFIFSIIILIIIALCINKLMIKISYKRDYSEYVNMYSDENNVDENLIYAIIKAESKFDIDAVSHKEAKGLMQIMPETAKDVAIRNGIKYSEENINDPKTNIQIGTIYISNLIKKYDSIGIALAAYNAGSGNVDRWIEKGIIKKDGSDIQNIPYEETNKYVKKVLKDYNIYKKI